MADVTQEERERAAQRELPEPDAAREWLETMMLIRRFEERAGEMYAKAKVGGFLHLAIGEEATIVGAVRAMRDEDYLISTYRSHGHALARGADPQPRDGRAVRPRGRRVARPRRLDAHVRPREPLHGRLRDRRRQPPARRRAWRSSSDYRGHRGGHASACSATAPSNQGTFGETLNLAALWKLPVVFMVTNNQFGMGTALERHSAVTDLHRRGEGFGVPGMRCDGMDVVDTYDVIGEAIQQRARGAPAGARRGDHLPLPRPLDGRPRGVPHQGAGRRVAQARPDRRRSPTRLEEEGVLEEGEAEKIDEAAVKRIDEAVAFADSSTFPPPESLYDHVYVLGDQVKGWYSVDERSAGVHQGEDERELAEAERGPTDAYDEAVEQAAREDVGSRRRRRGAGRGRRRRGGGRGLMAVVRYREALNQALREEMQRDESVFLMGEDIGVFNGAFKVTAGPARGVRREARARHADLREHDRRHGRRRRDDRAAAGRRADDDQLLAARDGPDRQPHGDDPLHVRRPGHGADGGADAAGRRPPARPDALALPRGAVPARARACCSPCRRPPADAKGLLKAAIRDDNPVVFIEHEYLYGQRGDVPDDDDHIVDFGQAAIRREGDDVTIVGISRMALTAEKAAEDRSPTSTRSRPR